MKQLITNQIFTFNNAHSPENNENVLIDNTKEINSNGVTMTDIKHIKGAFSISLIDPQI